MGDNNLKGKDDLDWWHKIARQKSETALCFRSNYPQKSNQTSEATWASSAIVNDTILNNAIYNRRMDSMQRRYAENKLIKMGINPFINNDKVTLMTDHLNPANNKKYGNVNDDKYKRYNRQKHSLFKSKNTKSINDELDFSLHPEIKFNHNEIDKTNKNDNSQSVGDFGNWLNEKSKEKPEQQANESKDSVLLFESIFNVTT